MAQPDTNWFTSSHCGANNSCVETARTNTGMRVRDTKDNGTGPVLTFEKKAWTDFLGLVETLDR
jgi:hypothetical protein